VKLLLLTQQLSSFTSGLGTYARALSEGLADAGHEIAVVTPRVQATEIEGVEVIPADFEPGNVTPFSRRKMARAFAAAAKPALELADLVHFLDAREAGLLDKPLLPSLGTVHDSYALDWTAPDHPRRLYHDRRVRGTYYRWLRGFERRAYRRLDLLTTNSDHVSETVASGYGVDPARLEVVRLGLPERPPSSPEPLDGDPAVLFVGGNYQRKGLPTLLAAVAAVAEEIPALVVHVVGGARSPEPLARRAARLGIEERVAFHGHRENDRVRAMMAGADVFAMPSLVEAFGLVYLEAMREGTPVIATSRGGAAECFRDGEDALLVPPGDVDALADALRRLAHDVAFRERLGAAGRETAGRFPPAATVRQTVALYERLLG